jgi:hypothetical protein
MRRKWVLGVGLAALVGSTAAGQQFGIDRPQGSAPTGTPKAAAPAVPGVFQPVVPASPTPPSRPTSPGMSGYTPLYSSPSSPTAPGAYVPPTDGVRPANYDTPNTVPSATANIRPVPNFTAVQMDLEVPTVLPKDHPWLLKPEHGQWFILVKSYVRPSKDSKAEKLQDDKGISARELGEGLASEIRDTFRVQAFLYEYISEEQKAEYRAVMAARQKAANEYVSQLAAIEQKSQLQGMNFMMPDNMFRVKKHESRDQIGVLVGGFQTEADANKALAVLKKWPAPKNELLMDGGAIVSTSQDGKSSTIERTRLNPYASAFVVRNPAIPHTQTNTAKPGLDPFLVKLNEGQPYSLLKATKSWTLSVKSFNAPVEIANKNSDTSLMRKFGFHKADVLAASAEQAEALAKAIRALKGPRGESLNLEAFVLHTRTSSLVTVGQFDGPDDPALFATQRMLANMKLFANPKGAPVMGATADLPFENLLPVPIPKP